MEGQLRPVADLDMQLKALERITQLFRAERLVYMCFAIAAFAMLIVSLGVALVQAGRNPMGVIGAFGSSGVVAFTSSRVLLMWQRAMSIVAPEAAPVADGKAQ